MIAAGFPIAGGYRFSVPGVGLLLHSPSGAEVYFQPGDEESAIRDTIEALQDMPEPIADAAAMADLSGYFA